MPNKTIKQLLPENSQKLAKISNEPRREAEDILAHVLKHSRAWLLAHSEQTVTSNELRVTSSLIKRRLKGEPLAYVLGEAEFYGLTFKVNRHVLIPRPETESLVSLLCHCERSEAKCGNLAVKSERNEIATSASTPPRNDMIIDVGTGSGAIAIGIARIMNYELGIKNIKLFAIDVSAQALAIAKQNAKLNHVDKNIKFIKGDLLKPLFAGHWKLKFENCLKIACLPARQENCKLKILCNLPYLKTSLPGLTKSQKHDLSFEPRIALFSGTDGLKYYRQLAKQIKTLKKLYPKLEIELLAEINPDQVKSMKQLFSFAKKIEVKKDFRKLNRLLIMSNFQ